MSPVKVRSKSENIQSDFQSPCKPGIFGTELLTGTDDLGPNLVLTHFNFTEEHFCDLDQALIHPILIEDICPPDFFITDFRLYKFTLIVAASNFQIVFVNLVTKAVMYRLQLESLANCVAISEDGKYLAVSILQDLNIYEIMGDLNHEINAIWLYKKQYNLHKSKGQARISGLTTRQNQ